MFNDLDIMVCEELLQYNPAKDMNSDFVFQRILGDTSIVDGDSWKDSNCCMVCEKHNHIKIEINQNIEVKDEEF